MSSAPRILVVSDDGQVARWLQHRIDTVRSGCAVELTDRSGFDHRLAASGAHCEMLLAVLDFGAGQAAESFEWIERMLGIPDMPPLAVLAEQGDELTAVGAVRRGACDYLPRRLVTQETLAALLEQALSHRRPRRAGVTSTATGIPPLPATLKVSRELIPRYMLLDTLGESARATVYLAHSAALNRHVALKVSRVAEDEEPQFAREFEAVGSLSDPGIVEIYDYGVNEGREFIAMEYFACGDLKARLLNPMSEQEALRYLQRIAGALAVVHSQGILHRDLKPPNIMLREDGRIVLIDFGLARNIDHGTHSTRAGVLRGSPYYMSPEQAQGLELDARSDLYSLGVIFHEMLTGQKPYLGATAVEVLQQHVSGELPQLPAELARHQLLLDGLMAKDRDERYPSAAALLDALAREAA